MTKSKKFSIKERANQILNYREYETVVFLLKQHRKNLERDKVISKATNALLQYRFQNRLLNELKQEVGESKFYDILQKVVKNYSGQDKLESIDEVISDLK